MAWQASVHRVCQGSAPPSTPHPQPRLCRQENLSIPKAPKSRCRGRAGFHGQFLSLSPPLLLLPHPSLSPLLSQSLSLIHLHMSNVELPTVGSPSHVLTNKPQKIPVAGQELSPSCPQSLPGTEVTSLPQAGPLPTPVTCLSPAAPLAGGSLHSGKTYEY